VYARSFGDKLTVSNTC